jgi:hypothetical protein
MDDILIGVSEYIAAADTSRKFKAIVYSEYVDECIAKNKIPFVDVVGIKERKSPLSGFSFDKGYRQAFDISIVIVQDAKLMKDVLHGTSSIWALWSYLWEIIEADRTFGGVVQRIDEKPVESKLITLVKDNSTKLGLETELTLILDVFK